MARSFDGRDVYCTSTMWKKLPRKSTIRPPQPQQQQHCYYDTKRYSRRTRLVSPIIVFKSSWQRLRFATARLAVQPIYWPHRNSQGTARQWHRCRRQFRRVIWRGLVITHSRALATRGVASRLPLLLPEPWYRQCSSLSPPNAAA